MGFVGPKNSTGKTKSRHRTQVLASIPFIPLYVSEAWNPGIRFNSPLVEGNAGFMASQPTPPNVPPPEISA